MVMSRCDLLWRWDCHKTSTHVGRIREEKLEPPIAQLRQTAKSQYVIPTTSTIKRHHLFGRYKFMALSFCDVPIAAMDKKKKSLILLIWNMLKQTCRNGTAQDDQVCVRPILVPRLGKHCRRNCQLCSEKWKQHAVRCVK